MEVNYKCTYPGCRHTQSAEQPPRHQHGQAQVEMREAIEVRGMRGDNLAGKDRSKHFNSYSE